MTPVEVLGKKYIINGSPADVKGFTHDLSAGAWYEVVRLIGGKFLFLQDHLGRLHHSVSGSGVKYPGDSLIRENLKLLQTVNDLSAGNIRICIQAGPEGIPNLLSYFIPHHYPDPGMYETGVRLEMYPHIRPNPGIKKWDDRFRTSVGRFIREKGIYEAVLVNDNHEVTEGSRSNLFFLDRGNVLVTAPGNTVLPGITRKYILAICDRQDIAVLERPIGLKELGRFQACFISGTSPGVLPVYRLDQFRFRVDHPLLRLLGKEFDRVMESHMESLINT
ncbi:MAG: hypothetical protein EHM46_00295 [Bacteroidetes bacterium]|nr:MAG: hypothetical protein EHM46_00295 [Bacteroidota bacterium]